MKANHPNRLRRQFAKFNEIFQKKSGDQHIEPQAQPEQMQGRAHRLSREDMQKITLAPPQESSE